MHTASNTQWGGQERRIYNECRWMEQQGHTIAIATHPDAPLFIKAKKKGWKTFDVSFKGSHCLKTFFQFKSIFRDFAPHILNTHGNMDAKICLSAARGMDIPCTILSRHITPAVKNSWYNRLLYGSWSDFIFTTSDYTSLQIVRDLNIPSTKVFTVSSGIVPPEEFLSEQTACNTIKEELSADTSRFFGYVGRLDPDKGLSELIKAFYLIQANIPDYTLVLVGEGGAESELRNLVKNLELENRIKFAGYQADPWQWFRALDCMVLASRANEGIPQSLLEAMFAGCPVIGTNVGGIPDVIENGVNGLLCLPKNPDSLAEAILDTLKQTEATISRVNAAREFVKKNHTIDAMGHKTLKILKKAIPDH